MTSDTIAFLLLIAGAAVFSVLFVWLLTRE